MNLAAKAATIGYAASGALLNPTRQGHFYSTLQLLILILDLVAAVGELTSMYPTTVFLDRLRDRMLATASGRRILRHRPIIHSSTIDLDHLRQLPSHTFGRAYVHFLDHEHVSPDTRTPIRFIDMPSDTTTNGTSPVDVHALSERAYVMLRYRQTHDFMHALTGLPTTLTGELALKWFEFEQTGLPMPFFSGLLGPLRLLTPFRFKEISVSANDQETWPIYWQVYLPWAMQAGNRAEFLLSVYFEEHFKEDLQVMRKRLHLLPVPHLK